MKNKSKKILAGLGFCLMGALALTGCASDITITQEDLDKTLEGVNNHFVTIEEGIDKYFNSQKTQYVGEDAKSLFNSLMSNAYFNSFNTKNFTVNATQKYLDGFGFESGMSGVGIAKHYYDEQSNTYKIIESSIVDGEEQIEYSELTIDLNANDGNIYIYKFYNLEEKTYQVSRGDYALDINRGLVLSGVFDRWYYDSLNPDNLYGCVVEKVGEGEYKVTYSTYTNRTSDDGISRDDEAWIEESELFFKNGNIVKYLHRNISVERVNSSENYTSYRNIVEMTFDIDYSCEQINIDTSDCVLDEGY